MTKRLAFSKFMSLVLCLITMFSLVSFNSSAATSGGSGRATVNVTSKANYLYPGASSITLKQQKQTITYKALFSNKTKTKSGYYGCYDITVYNVTKDTTKSVYWGGGQTKKITLDPNCSYRITVTYNSTCTIMFTKAPTGYSYSRATSPGWWVSSKWKVSSCW